jgi:diaminopimelate decarboxylase
MHNSTLFGMTCDGMDVITKNIKVPIDMKVSDWLCFSGMGAYTYGSKSTFNGMKATDKVIKWEANVHQQTKFS